MSSIIEKLGITPGPWRVGCDLESINTDYKSDGENWNKLNCTKNGFAKCIAKIRRSKWMKPSEALKNARLIAAAPEMLERDIVFLKGLEKMREHYQSFMRDREIAVIDKIISMFNFSPDKKATGKSWEEIKKLLESDS